MAYIKSQGCTVHKLDTTVSPNAYEQIGQVISIGGPTGSTGEIDVTHLSSVAKEFISSLPDWGNVSLGIIWDPGTTSTLHSDIYADFVAGTVATYQIRLSNSPQTTMTFDAFPNGHPINIAVDDKVGVDVTLRCTGNVVLA